MRKDHRVRLNAIKKTLVDAQNKLSVISNEMELSLGIFNPDLLYNKGNSTYINSQHLEHCIGQLGCGLEDIHDAFNNVTRLKHRW